MRPDRRKRLKTAFVVAALVTAFSFTVPRCFCFALPKSLNHWLFWKVREKGEIRRGDYVLYDHSDKATGWKSLRMIKLVACNEGDILSVVDKKFYCNGAYLGKAKDKALNGTPLQSFVWEGPVPKGKILALGEHRDSYDSRYYGFISKSKILCKACPVFE